MIRTLPRCIASRCDPGMAQTSILPRMKSPQPFRGSWYDDPSHRGVACARSGASRGGRFLMQIGDERRQLIQLRQGFDDFRERIPARLSLGEERFDLGRGVLIARELRLQANDLGAESAGIRAVQLVVQT